MANIKRANTSGVTKSGVAIADVPDRPAIGTASVSGITASVPFTAATTGGTATTFTATSTPGSITGTASSSPITVTGLAGDTSYTFTVFGTNSTASGPASTSSNSITTVDPLIGGYDALSSVTLSTATSAITFSGIPTGYKHLQVRLMAKYSTGTTGEGAYTFAINGTNLPRSHYVAGDGSSASANTLTAGYQGSIPLAGNSGWGVSIHDVLDYSDAVKNKTVRTLNAWDNNGSGLFLLYSGMTTSTDAVSSITITGASTFAINSSFALYGVK